MMIGGKYIAEIDEPHGRFVNLIGFVFVPVTTVMASIDKLVYKIKKYLNKTFRLFY